MYDSFSEGKVFYGRAALVVTATMVVAALLHLL